MTQKASLDFEIARYADLLCELSLTTKTFSFTSAAVERHISVLNALASLDLSH